MKKFLDYERNPVLFLLFSYRMWGGKIIYSILHHKK